MVRQIRRKTEYKTKRKEPEKGKTGSLFDPEGGMVNVHGNTLNKDKLFSACNITVLDVSMHGSD